MSYQWFPGHMTKAIRAMQEDIKLIDLVVEIIDARVPVSSRNPEIDTLAKGKSRLIVFNKSDLAADSSTEEFIKIYEEKGMTCIKTDARNSGSVKKVQEAIDRACADKIARDLKKGIKNRPIRAMVVGIPNVGKSTFINSLAGKACAKTGNKPGVTKGKQWIRLNKRIELLDTPGVLWPKFESQVVGLHLAMIGSINDEIIDEQELAYQILNMVLNKSDKAISERYGIDILSLSGDNKALALLEEIGRKRGCLIKGGEVDLRKASKIVLDDFRAGRLGRISVDSIDML